MPKSRTDRKFDLASASSAFGSHNEIKPHRLNAFWQSATRTQRSTFGEHPVRRSLRKSDPPGAKVVSSILVAGPPAIQATCAISLADQEDSGKSANTAVAAVTGDTGGTGGASGVGYVTGPGGIIGGGGGAISKASP